LSRNEIKDLLSKCKVIAIVGLSNDPLKYSFSVGAYLKKHGIRIIPVNPFVKEVLGEKSYNRLLDIPTEIQKTIDIVDIFRKSEEVPLIVQQAIELKRKVGRPIMVWMQEGVSNKSAADMAEQAGLNVLMDVCLMKAYMQLGAAKQQRYNSSDYNDS